MNEREPEKFPRTRTILLLVKVVGYKEGKRTVDLISYVAAVVGLKTLKYKLQSTF
jgi:hypothetical protein